MSGCSRTCRGCARRHSTRSRWTSRAGRARRSGRAWGWGGEPGVAVVAQSRAEAEDAADAVEVDYEELPAALDAERALEPSEPKIHKEFDSNLCFTRTVDTGNVDAAMKSAHLVVEDTVHFGRHTGVTMEPRAILADYNLADP